MPIELMRERLIIAKLVVAVLRARARQIYPDLGIAESFELQLITTAVFIGHAEQKLMSASDLSRYLQMPRPTVIRKLAVLMKRGLVAKRGRGYCINAAAVNGLEASRAIKANVRRIKAAAIELSKLDM